MKYNRKMLALLVAVSMMSAGFAATGYGDDRGDSYRSGYTHRGDDGRRTPAPTPAPTPKPTPAPVPTPVAAGPTLAQVEAAIATALKPLW